MAKILVAEDSATELELIRQILRDTKHEIAVAGDGDEAERMARTKEFDMLILDIIMPKKNGYQVCRNLRADSALKGLPIIMISSKSQESDKVWGMKQGATEYLTKPYAPIDLLAAVRRHLKNA
jgi:twitching motility two-component system response regulator PilH